MSPGANVPGAIQLVSIDPGTKKSAIAAWNNYGQLVFADDLPNSQIRTFLNQITTARVVIETPVLYPKSRKVHKDVKRLLIIAQEFKNRVQNGEAVKPSEWKGQVPKNIHKHRILKALTQLEMRSIITPDNHNTIDAIGIGLFALGRLGRGGISRG